MKVYIWTKIGDQTWMAENLAYAPSSGSYCYDNNANNCAIYGRLYTWSAASTACPTGWHLPADDEWSTLVTSIGGANGEGKKLKAASDLWFTNTGTDLYGFTGLPGGLHNAVSSELGTHGRWWSSTPGPNSKYYGHSLTYNDDVLYRNTYVPSYGFSVRCVQDAL